MNKTLIVLKHEMLTILRSKSFILTLILIPLVSFIVILVAGNLQGSTQGEAIAEIITPRVEVENQGLVDESGLILEIPTEMSVRLRQFMDVGAAEIALESGEIGAYYVIPDDYMQRGIVYYYRPDFNPVGGMGQTVNINGLIQYNLLTDQTELLVRIQNPLQLETMILSPEPQRDPASGLTFFLPYGVTFLFYLFILGSASLMLNSVTNEKQNRVMEMLLTSMTPIQLMTGKIVALGLVGLLQTVVWTSAGYFLLRLSGRTFALPEEFQLPVSIIFWGVVFFILGYAIYASLMAGVGALVPNLREASQATFLVIIPLIIPLMFVSLLIQRPHAVASIILSLFPLTAPVAMMTRLAATQVPIWQLLLASGLQILTAILIIRSVAGLFRAQNLLSGQSFNLKVFFQAITNRA
jgi:ABC-2 type transport system permease protein